MNEQHHLLSLSLLALHQAHPSLLPKEAIDAQQCDSILEAVCHAKDVLLSHVDQLEAVEYLLLQLGAARLHQHERQSPKGYISRTAPELQHTPLPVQPLPSGSISACGTGHGPWYPPISQDRASQPQQQNYRASPSRDSSSSSFLGMHLDEGGGEPGSYNPNSRLASSLTALAQAQQQKQQQQQQQQSLRPLSQEQPHLLPQYSLPHASSSSIMPASSSSNTSGIDTELFRFLSMNPHALTELPVAPSASSLPTSSRPSQSSLQVLPHGFMSPSTMRVPPLHAATAAGVSQLPHKQPRRVQSSLPHQWHSGQLKGASPMQQQANLGSQWSMHPPNVPLIAAASAESLPAQAQAASQPLPSQIMYAPPLKRSSSSSLDFSQLQQQQQQILLLNQLARQQQQSGPGQLQNLQQASRPQQARQNLKPNMSAPSVAGLARHDLSGSSTLSHVSELERPMSTLSLGSSAPMASNLQGGGQDMFSAPQLVGPGGLTGDGLLGKTCGDANNSDPPSLVGHSHSGPGFGISAAGLGPGGWVGGGLGVVDKKEGTGNKRSGASRRRKAKMYQSLNAMVQSVLEDDSKADLSAAAMMASSGMFPEAVLYQNQQLQQQLQLLQAHPQKHQPSSQQRPGQQQQQLSLQPPPSQQQQQPQNSQQSLQPQGPHPACIAESSRATASGLAPHYSEYSSKDSIQHESAHAADRGASTGDLPTSDMPHMHVPPSTVTSASSGVASSAEAKSSSASPAPPRSLLQQVPKSGPAAERVEASASCNNLTRSISTLAARGTYSLPNPAVTHPRGKEAQQRASCDVCVEVAAKQCAHSRLSLCRLLSGSIMSIRNTTAPTE